MNAPDISPLVKGVLAIILFSIGFGQFGTVERWARAQALAALEWKEPLPYFFGSALRPHCHTHLSVVMPHKAG